MGDYAQGMTEPTQQSAQPGDFVGHAALMNPSRKPGTRHARLCLPLPRGAVTEKTPAFTLRDPQGGEHRCIATVAGALYGDGSARTVDLFCIYPWQGEHDQMEPGSIGIVGKAPSQMDFDIVYKGRAAGYNASTMLTLSAAWFKPWTFDVVMAECGALELGPAEILRQAGDYAQIKRIGTGPGGLWCELIYEIHSSLGIPSPVVPYQLRAGYCSPDVQGWSRKTGEVKIVTTNCQAWVEHADVQVQSQKHERLPGFYMSELVLDSGDGTNGNEGCYGFGQGVACYGQIILDTDPGALDARPDLLLAADAASYPPECYGMAEWAGAEEAFGAHGRIPDAAARPAIQFCEDRAKHIHRRHRGGSTGGPWGMTVMGCLPEPGSTGGQADFGVSHLGLDARFGVPDFYHPWKHDVGLNAHRGMWLREADGSAMKAANHPDLMLWSSIPNTRIPGDHYGQAEGYPSWGWARKSQQGSYYYGFNWEHYSTQQITHFAMVTGDPLARAMCGDMVEIMLATAKLSGTNARVRDPRAYARMGQTMLMLYLVTGDIRMWHRLVARYHLWTDQLRVSNDGTWSVTAVKSSWGGYWDGKTSFAMPWQEAFVAELHAGMIATAERCGHELPASFERANELHLTGLDLMGWCMTSTSRTGWSPKGVAAKAAKWNNGNGPQGPDDFIGYSGYQEWLQSAAQLHDGGKYPRLEAKRGEILMGRSETSVDSTTEVGWLSIGPEDEYPIPGDGHPDAD